MVFTYAMRLYFLSDILFYFVELNLILHALFPIENKCIIFFKIFVDTCQQLELSFASIEDPSSRIR